MMPKKPFINSLTSNILDENNRLKTELIEVRKHFKCNMKAYFRILK